MSALVEFPPELYNPRAFDGFKEQSEFRIENALTLMWLSQLAYETHQQGTIDHVQKLWEFDRVIPFAKQGTFVPEGASHKRFNFDTRGVIGEKGNSTFIAFAGTDGALWQNVWTDVDFVRKGTTDMHQGFQAACDAVQDIIDEALKARRKYLFLAGHSLGAALAVIAAYRAFKSGNEPTAVYTYGLPRVGGKTFAADYDRKLGDRTYRLVHGIDIVPRVPPAAFGFVHVGRLLHCAPGTNFQSGPLSAPGSNKPTLFTGTFAALRDLFGKIRHGEWLSPPGPGPLRPFFRLLIPPIREHLEDRYLIALGDSQLDAALKPKSEGERAS